MSERSYAPPLGIQGSTGTLDPDMVSAFALALRMHEGRYLVVPRTYKVANPAAGSDWSIQVPMGVSWLMQGVTTRLTNDANAANRGPRLTVNDGTNDLTWSPVAGTLTAGAIYFPTWVRGYGAVINIGAGNTTAQDMHHAVVPGGYTVKTVTPTIQVGDQWSQIVIWVLEIRERTPNERACYMEDLLAGRPTTDYPGLLLGL